MLLFWGEHYVDNAIQLRNEALLNVAGQIYYMYYETDYNYNKLIPEKN